MLKSISRIVLVVILVVAVWFMATGGRAAEKRPNILFIFTDDHAAPAISAYGDTRHLIDTPNIDRIAREGMRFDRCLVPNPLCGPSRACVLTGTYNHVNGFVNNTNCRFDQAQVTFPRLLQGAGYQTALIGKWHLESDPCGFDFWQILPGQGAYYNPAMIRGGERIVERGYVTDIITERSLEWLRHRDKTKPFLLMSQHKAPHRWWEPALRHLAADGDRRYPEPATLFDDFTGRGAAERDAEMTIARTLNDRDLKLVPMADLDAGQRAAWDDYYAPRNAAFRAERPQGEALVRWKYQRYLHDYLACVRAVDESVGRLLDYLDHEGLTQDTIVVYSSDQGFFLGEHGWIDKRWIYEEAMRTPLLVRWPAHVEPGRVNHEIVSNLDFAETFLEAAGEPVPETMQGHSLLPLLRGERPPDWRTSFYFQYFEYPAFHRVRPHYGLVTERYKLVHFFGTTDESWRLFDRATDPDELRDVYESPDYRPTRQRLTRALAAERARFRVPATIPAEWLGTSTQFPPEAR